MASDVAALVSEMNGTLVDIRQTIDALSTATHTSRLDQLEHQRDSTIAALRANFERETDDLVVKRRRERDEIAERRRQEDEEIAARRRCEDEDMGERDGREDGDRERRFVSETDDVEDEMDGLMEGVETEAESFLAQGRDKLAQLEERRKELNRLIDEQVQVPFPTVTTRRRSRNQRTMDAAITSKPAPALATSEPVNNPLKAIKEEGNSGVVEGLPQQAGGAPQTIGAEEDERAVSGSENASRGSFESVGPRRSRTASVSSSQRGSRMSAFGWIAGKIGLSETREEAEAGQNPEDISRPEVSAVAAVPEVPDRSPARSEGANASEIPANRQELTPETFVPEVGEKDAAPDLEEVLSADLPTLESVAYNGEAQVTTISPTRVSDNEPRSPVGETESHELALAQHEIQDPTPGDQESFPEADLAPGNAFPTRHPSKDAHNELNVDHDQHPQPIVTYNEETNGAELSHDQSTASSRAESLVETAPGLSGSETTLEVDLEPYQEQEFIQKTKDNDGDGVFGREQEAIYVRDGEADSGIRGMGSDLGEEESQMSVIQTGPEDTNAEGDPLSPGLDEERSPPLHTHDNGATVLDVDPEDVQYGLGVDVDVTAGSVPAQRELQEIQDAQSIPSPPAVMDEETPRPVPESLAHEPAEQSHGFDHGASEVTPSGQDYEDNVTAFDNEVIQQMEEAPAPQYQAEEEAMDTTFEPATDDAPQNIELDQDSEAPETLDEYPPIELPSHAMDYSLGLDTMQLPNGTWPAGAVDEDSLASLIAQFLVPSLISSSRPSHRDGEILPLSPEVEKLSSHPLEDHFDPVAPHSDERINDDELVAFVYPSFAHERKPMAVQLASGVWSIDPTDGEFEDARASQNAAVSEVHSPTLNSPEYGVAYSSEEPSVHGAAVYVEPVAMQLPSGAWVTDPSEEEYESVSTQTQQISIPVDHFSPTMDTVASPIADLHDDIPSDVVQSPTRTGLDNTSLAADPEETVQEAKEEQASFAQASEVGNRDGILSMEEAEGPSEQVLSGNQGEHPSYGASQAASTDGTALPWSPFNSRIPLSPESSPATPVQSPQLAEAHEVMPDESADAIKSAGRHSTFGYGSGQAGPEATEYQTYDIPDNPYAHADMLNITEAATDSDSQNFVTPLQSAGMQSPQASQDAPDAFHSAVDYAHGEAPHEEAAMTVHGQDELFDSDSMSEYEPDPSVDENGDPRANLGMPPQHHVFANGHAEEATDSPDTAILQPAAENPHLHTPDMAPAVEDNSDVSPLSLRGSTPPPPIPPRRGLASSRHNPERPITPPTQTIPEDLSSHRGTWDASGPIDSTPMSLVSRSTLSSSPDSPVRERIHEGREPAIQNSWSEGMHGDQNGHQDYEREYEDTPAQDTKLDENLPTPIATHMPESVRDYSPATPSPSSLIQKMRGIFENSSVSSPVRSRPSSEIYNQPRPLESPGYDIPGEPRKGGFLNEAEDEVDERSALLGSVGRN